MRKPVNTLLLTMFTLIAATVYIGCDGGGGGGGAENSQPTTINGRIKNLVTASSNADKDFNLALIKE